LLGRTSETHPKAALQIHDFDNSESFQRFGMAIFTA
jgi:hypothetical protein